MRRFRAIPPPLRRELEARLAGDLRSARSSIVMIDGPVGSGKSSMLDRIADLTGRTMPTIGPLDASAPLVLAELALAVGAPATASPEVVLERLVGMATEPLVVAIDDLDHGTARLSHLLAAAVRSADHLAVVATVRRARGFAGAARGLVRELDRGVDHERIHLDPLSADDITAWLRAGLDPVAEPTHGAIVWRWSGGLPALVDQIVADAERTRPTAPLQAIDEPDFAPVTGEVVLDRWLALFEPEGLEIIEAVALAGSVRDDERHLIAAACNAPLASVDHVIEAALADGVLADDRGGSGRSVRIGARSLRDGLIRRTPPDRRRRMLDVLVATDPGVERPRQAARLLAHTEHRPLTDDDIATLSAASEEIATVDPDRAAQWAEVVATQAGPETVIGARAVNRSAELRSLAARVHRDLDPPPWQRITDPATRDATAALALYAGLYANDWHAVIDQAEAVAPVVDEDPELWPTTRAAVLSVLTPCGRHQWARELAERWMPTVAPEDRSVLDDFAVVGLQPGSQRRDNLRELQEIVARLPDDTPLAMRVNVVMAEVLALLTTGPMQLLRDRVAELHADPIISTLPMAIDGLLIASSYEAYLAGRCVNSRSFGRR